MTCKTRQPRIPAPPTFAALQSIRLKPNIRHARNLRLQNVRPSPVTRPAKIHRSHRPQFPRIQNHPPPLIEPTRLHRRNMLRPRPMTLLASNPWRRVRRIKSPCDHRPARVTPETMLRLAAVHAPSKRRFDRSRRLVRMPRRQRQRPQRPVKTDAALVIRTAARINVSLSGMRDAKRPLKLRRSFPRIVRNGIRASIRTRAPRNFISKGRQLPDQLLTLAQNLRIRGPRSGMRHRRSRLGLRLVRVTLRAFRTANELRPIGHILRRPPCRRSNAIFRRLRNFSFVKLSRLAQHIPGECKAHAEKKQPTRRA